MNKMDTVDKSHTGNNIPETSYDEYVPLARFSEASPNLGDLSRFTPNTESTRKINFGDVPASKVNVSASDVADQSPLPDIITKETALTDQPSLIAEKVCSENQNQSYDTEVSFAKAIGNIKSLASQSETVSKVAIGTMEPEQLEMSLKRPELLEAVSTPDAGPNQSLQIEPAPIIKRGTIAEPMEDIVESNDPMQSGKVVEENDMAELVAEAENQALKRDCEFDAKSPSKKQKTDDCSPEESAPVDNALLENAGKVGKENPPQHMSKNARESRKYPAVKVYSVFRPTDSQQEAGGGGGGEQLDPLRL